MNSQTSLINVEKLSPENIINRSGISSKGGKGIGIRAAKLNQSQQFELIDLLGRGYTLTQVLEEINKRFDINLNISTIQYYMSSKSWKPKIRQIRNYYAQNLNLVPGASKAVRLFRMEHVIDKANAKDELRTVVSATENQRREFEKDGGDTTNVYVNNTVYNQLKILPNDELLRRHKEAVQRMKVLQLKESHEPVRTSEKDK